MLKKLAMWMSLMLSLNIMFAPILYYVDSMHRQAVETVLQEGAKKAAIEGRFSSSIIDEMKDELVTNYNFAESEIEITATQTLTTRNNYIDATIEVPRGIIFIFNIFNQGPDTIEKSVRVMSEY